MWKLSTVILGILMAFTALSASASTEFNRSALIAAVVDVDGQILVFINSRDEWNRNHRLTDTYSEAEQLLVDDLTDQLSLCNEMESTYSPCKPGLSAEGVRTQLRRAGVEVHQEFEQWMTEEFQ